MAIVYSSTSEAVSLHNKSPFIIIHILSIDSIPLKNLNQYAYWEKSVRKYATSVSKHKNLNVLEMTKEKAPAKKTDDWVMKLEKTRKVLSINLKKESFMDD